MHSNTHSLTLTHSPTLPTILPIILPTNLPTNLPTYASGLLKKKNCSSLSIRNLPTSGPYFSIIHCLQPALTGRKRGGVHALALSYCLRVCSTRPPGKRVWVEVWGVFHSHQYCTYKYLRNRSLTIIRRWAPRCCSPGRQDSCIKKVSDDVLPKELPG